MKNIVAFLEPAAEQN